MDIIVAGGGKVGELLCLELVNEGNNVTLIEKNQKKLERLVNKNDITGVIGNCVNYDTLLEANADLADMFIAVTSEDEINIIACIIAQKLGVEHTIARVRNPEYSEHIDFMRKGMGISMIINPESEAAEYISRVIKYPKALSIEELAEGRVNISEIYIDQSSPLVGVEISNFRQKFGNVLVTAILRGDETIIPTGLTTLQEGDEIFVIGSKEELNGFYKKITSNKSEIKSVLIIGGGTIAHYLVRLLLDIGINVKVIENNFDVAKNLAANFPKAIVIEGDGTDPEVLAEERIESYDAVVTLTGVDEENILTSMFAMSLENKKIITKVSRTALLKIMGNIGQQTIITPKRLIAYSIIRFVRSMKYKSSSSFENFFRFADNSAEAMQFKVGGRSKVINIPLVDIKLKPNILIAFIIRKHQLIFPKGSDMIKPGDEVIIVTTNKAYDEIDDILV